MLWKVLESWSQVGGPLSFPPRLPKAQQEAAGLAPSLPWDQSHHPPSDGPSVGSSIPCPAHHGPRGARKSIAGPRSEALASCKGEGRRAPSPSITPSPVGADEPHGGDRAGTHRFSYHAPNSWAVLLPGWQLGGREPWGWWSPGVQQWPRPGHRPEGSRVSSTAKEAASFPRAPGACCVLGPQRGWPPRSPWVPRLGATVARAAPPAELPVVPTARCFLQDAGSKPPHIRVLRVGETPEG